MRLVIRALALGAVLVVGAATASMAQGVNNTGYDRGYYGDPNYPGYYRNYSGYYRDDGRYMGYPGYRDRYVPGPVAGPMMPPYAERYGYDYYGNNGYGSSYEPGWGSGGGAAYDRGYSPYNYGYWGR
jgi:hypothetical protein